MEGGSGSLSGRKNDAIQYNILSTNRVQVPKYLCNNSDSNCNACTTVCTPEDYILFVTINELILDLKIPGEDVINSK